VSESVFLVSILAFLSLISFLFLIISPAKRFGDKNNSVSYLGLFYLILCLALLSILFISPEFNGVPISNSLFILSVYCLLHGLKLRVSRPKPIYVQSIVVSNIVIIALFSWVSAKFEGHWTLYRLIFISINVAAVYFACYKQIKYERGEAKLNYLVEIPFLIAAVLALVMWIPFYLTSDYLLHVRFVFATSIIINFITFGGVLSLLLSDVINFHYKNSITDGLTGLFNRRHFSMLGKKLVIEANRYDFSVSCVMCDIDDFKAVNDNYGHDTGDKVIVAFSKSLEKNLRTGDILARIGGEEFVVLLNHVELSNALEIAERMRASTEAIKIENNDFSLNFTASFGVAELEKADVDELLKNADEALYKSKNNGKNIVTAFKA